MNKKLTGKASGFTIIEVVLVLAIAGLIFLIVFLAVPALQRSQRDSQRRSDISRFATQIQQFQSNNKSRLPTAGTAACTSTAAGSVNNFVTNYLTVGGDTWSDPQTGNVYGCVNAAPAVGEYWYQTGVKCDGEGTTTTGAGARNYAVITKLEGSGSLCQGN